MRIILHKTRLSWFFFLFFVGFYAASYFLPDRQLEPAALTLFSVNSFLFGFYVAPVLGRQTARIEELGKAIRAEANALFEMLLRTKSLHRKTRNTMQDMYEDYMKACIDQHRTAEGEAQYEKLITFCLKYEGEDKEVMDKVLNSLVTNQQNRSNLAMQIANRVYGNEWWIILVLFSITLSFVLFLKVGDSWVMHLTKALLCSGLSMLMINLLKLNTLTHKKAKGMWHPFKKLLETRFYRID